MHLYVRQYNELFGSHVDTQAVFMFPYKMDTYDVFNE